MAPTTVALRVRPETRERLKALARRRSTTAVDALDEIVGKAYEEQLLAEMAEGAAASAELPEVRDWDALADDGLDTAGA